MAYYGYPRRNYSFYPYPEVIPNQYLNPYHHSDPNGNQFFNPYYYPNHFANSRSNLNRNPHANPNPRPQYAPNPNPTMRPNPNPSSTSRPRFVSIPVHFVNSDSEELQLPAQLSTPVVYPRLSAETAALKLQKVIRGFLVRKNWRIVRKIEAEAEAIGEEIARDEAVLAKEEKARIRIGEMLMNLLFRLDSVRGVRDYRKKVIKKVISLQELVDSIGARGDRVEADAIEVDKPDVAIDSVEHTNTEENKMVETVDAMEETPNDVTDSIETDKCEEEGPSSDVEQHMIVEEAMKPMEESPVVHMKPIETSQMEKSCDTPDMTEVCTEAQELEEVCDPTETLELDENVTRSNTVDHVPEPLSQVGTSNKENNEIEMKGVREVMEKVVEEGEKMKNLMEELCKSSARQWRLMEGLVDRVQRLEREVARMERRDKKKKKGRKSESFSRKYAQCNSS